MRLRRVGPGEMTAREMILLAVFLVLLVGPFVVSWWTGR